MQGWVEARTEQWASKVKRRMLPVLADAAEAFVGEPITASGEEAAAVVWEVWALLLPELAEELAEVYEASMIYSFVGLLGATLDDLPEYLVPPVNAAVPAHALTAVNNIKQLGPDMWGHLRAQISDALEQGLPIEEVKERVEAATKWSEYKADTVARTEMQSAYANGDAKAMDVLVADGDGPVEKVWLATADARTRATHLAANDQVRRMDELFDVGGVQMRHPHAAGAPAGEVANCRCTTLYLWPGDERPDGTVVPEP